VLVAINWPLKFRKKKHDIYGKRIHMIEFRKCVGVYFELRNFLNRNYVTI